ncbi:MAG: hypothetical protein H7X91_00020 [Burkholderiales bacterium]|nr:hypothetical protein [Burkholderiales bacterium]
MAEQSRFKEIGLPLLSAAIALIGVLSGYVLNTWTERSQAELKTFEVTFPEKQKSYAKLMRLLSDSFYSAAWRQKEDYYKFADDLEASYFGLEPFLSDANRKATWEEIQSFIEFCNQIRSEDPTTDMDVER